MTAASLCRYSFAGESVGEVLQRGLRVYEKTGHEFAWLETCQGYFAGAAVRDEGIFPEIDVVLAPGHAVSWMPMVHGVPSADTVLVGEAGSELLAFFEDWPTIAVHVREATITRPDILVR